MGRMRVGAWRKVEPIAHKIRHGCQKWSTARTDHTTRLKVHHYDQGYTEFQPIIPSRCVPQVPCNVLEFARSLGRIYAKFAFGYEHFVRAQDALYCKSDHIRSYVYHILLLFEVKRFPSFHIFTLYSLKKVSQQSLKYLVVKFCLQLLNDT